MSYMCSATNLDVGVVCAHDIAGFGQSQPPNHHHEYTLQHDGCCVTPAALEHALVRAGLPAGGGRDAGIVFCGHSMGCISAVFSAVEWLERGHRTPSVLLIAPAIAASAGAAEACRFDLATQLWLRALFAALAWVRVVGALGAIAIRTMIFGLVSLPRFWQGGLHVAFSFHSGLPTARTAAQYASAAQRKNWTDGLLAFIDECSTCTNLTLETSALHKECNAEVSHAFTLSDGRPACIKFHNRPLYEVVDWEKKQGTVVPVPEGYFAEAMRTRKVADAHDVSSLSSRAVGTV
jgi:hypothetical protein